MSFHPFFYNLKILDRVPEEDKGGSPYFRVESQHHHIQPLKGALLGLPNLQPR